jgi:release factor glutamine methyltransferase
MNSPRPSPPRPAVRRRTRRFFYLSLGCKIKLPYSCLLIFYINMIAGNALLWGIRKLKPLEKTSHGDLAAFDVEILLAFVLKKPKEFLYAHPEKKLTAAQLAHFKKLITRRAKHEPIAYITNQKEFFGLNFYVDKNVLIPRPETETLVEATISNIKYPISNSQTIVDIGAGSGCVAVSLAKRFPNAKIFATEISSGAMKVARKNARHHKAAVIFFRGNLISPFL